MFINVNNFLIKIEDLFDSLKINNGKLIEHQPFDILLKGFFLYLLKKKKNFKIKSRIIKTNNINNFFY